MKNILFILTALFAFNSNALAKVFDLVVTPSHVETPTVKPKELKVQEKPFLGKKLLIMISSGELEKAGMGFTLGLSAAKKGVAVTYVIGAKALNSVKRKGPQNKFIPKMMTHREILKEAIKHGATVEICYMCAKALGLTNKDFIKGSKIVKSKIIFSKMYEKDMRVLSF